MTARRRTVRVSVATGVLLLVVTSVAQAQERTGGVITQLMQRLNEDLKALQGSFGASEAQYTRLSAEIGRTIEQLKKADTPAQGLKLTARLNKLRATRNTVQEAAVTHGMTIMEKVIPTLQQIQQQLRDSAATGPDGAAATVRRSLKNAVIAMDGFRRHITDSDGEAALAQLENTIDGVAAELVDSVGVPGPDAQIENVIRFLNVRYRDLDMTRGQLLNESRQIKVEAAADTGTIVVMAVSKAFGGFDEPGLTPREVVLERRGTEAELRVQQKWQNLGNSTTAVGSGSRAQRLQSLRDWNEQQEER